MKTKYSLPILLALAPLTSCNDFLEEKPTSSIVSEFFYETDKDIDEAVNAVYAPLADNWQQRLGIITELRADYVIAGPEANGAARLLQFENYSYDNLNNDIVNTWTSFYKAIDNANNVIEQVPAATLADEAHKLRVVAEARFLRAYAYYNLVRLWGEVPLKLTATRSGEGLNLSKSTIDEIYQSIISDLLEASGQAADGTTYLPLAHAGVNNGRVTLGAANGLLAEVYLTRGMWSQAVTYAKKVIDSNRYDLWANYLDAFLFKNKYAANAAPNGEAIFEIQYHHDAGVPSVITRWCAPRGARLLGVDVGRAGFGNYAATPAAYTLFADTDERRGVIFPATFKNNNNVDTRLNPDPKYPSVYNMMKYRLDDQPTARFGNSANNWPILRYADILLIYAEALNEVNGGPDTEAYAAINKVRARAEQPPLADLAQEAFRNAVYEERARELFFEGDRFFDLVRTNRFVAAMSAAGITVSENQKFLPIPQSELDINPNL